IEQIPGEVRSYLSSLGHYMGERDQALTQWLQRRADATAAPAGTTGLDAMEAGLRDAVALHVQALHERIGLQAKTFAELLAAQSELQESQMASQGERLAAMSQQLQAVNEATSTGLERMCAVLEHRLTEVTEQVWADALALRTELTEQVAQAGGEGLGDIDERLGRMTELVNAALGWAVDQLHDHVQRETLRSVQVGMADVLAAMDRRFVDLDRSMMVQVDRTGRSLGERLEAMDRRIEAGLTSLEESFAERSGAAMEAALSTAKSE